MKPISIWYVAAAIFVGLVLILASAAHVLPISEPLAVIIGLGLPAGILLWEHRVKMMHLIGRLRSNR